MYFCYNGQQSEMNPKRKPIDQIRITAWSFARFRFWIALTLGSYTSAIFGHYIFYECPQNPPLPTQIHEKTRLFGSGNNSLLCIVYDVNLSCCMCFYLCYLFIWKFSFIWKSSPKLKKSTYISAWALDQSLRPTL